MDQVKEKGGQSIGPRWNHSRAAARINSGEKCAASNAALLFTDYVLSPEGMELRLRRAACQPARMGTPLDTKSIILDVTTIMKLTSGRRSGTRCFEIALRVERGNEMAAYLVEHKSQMRRSLRSPEHGWCDDCRHGGKYLTRGGSHRFGKRILAAGMRGQW
jgi:hypothetical protein